MDLKKATKPVHLRCPKCGHDFACNTNRIEEDYSNAKIKAASATAELARLRNQGCDRRSPRYKRAIEKLEDARMQCAAIKKVRKAIRDEGELQMLNIFRKKVMNEIGMDRTVELLHESEDELCFHDYDTAIQRYNNFDGV